MCAKCSTASFHLSDSGITNEGGKVIWFWFVQILTVKKLWSEITYGVLKGSILHPAATAALAYALKKGIFRVAGFNPRIFYFDHSLAPNIPQDVSRIKYLQMNAGITRAQSY